jgi:hypothetical protein
MCGLLAPLTPPPTITCGTEGERDE